MTAFLPQSMFVVKDHNLKGIYNLGHSSIRVVYDRNLKGIYNRYSRMISVMNRHGHGSHMVVSPEVARHLLGITEE